MIKRRDFLNCVALSLAGTSIPPIAAMGLNPRTAAIDYPPVLTGLRGSHPGSFEVAHDLAWRGKQWARPSRQTDQTYDLVVVGGGISGLTAAWYFRQERGDDCRILILENHDDFGGHAKQVEFNVDGKHLISYGGSQTLVFPSYYPESAKQLFDGLGLHVEKFSGYFDKEFYAQHMQPGIYFDKAQFGESKLTASPLGTIADLVGAKRSHAYKKMIEAFPVDAETRRTLINLFVKERDEVYPGLSQTATLTKIQRQSYRDFLVEEHDMTETGLRILLDYMRGPGTGLSLGAHSVAEATYYGMPIPGIATLGAEYASVSESGDPNAYICHFPSGNAGLTRMMVRAMIPESAPGTTMEDLTLARFNYGALDSDSNQVRIRLNSTAIDVRHTADNQAVDITYIRDGQSEKVQAKHVVMACYNHILPFICPEMETVQRDALGYAEKVPMIYTQIALRNWKAIDKSGYGVVYAPGTEVPEFWLDFPVSMGGYEYARTPDDPIVLSAFPNFSPTDTGDMPVRELLKASRYNVYTKSFADYEKAILGQLEDIWSPYGMDPKRDVAAITVNRWPHGYAYSYSPLHDPPEYNSDNGPHITGRQQLHRISIGNSDAGATARVDTAIEQGYRAVKEQLGLA